jgi:hypothetical protein
LPFLKSRPRKRKKWNKKDEGGKKKGKLKLKGWNIYKRSKI